MNEMGVEFMRSFDEIKKELVESGADATMEQIHELSQAAEREGRNPMEVVIDRMKRAARKRNKPIMKVKMVLVDSDGTEKVVLDSDIKTTCAAFVDMEGNLHVSVSGSKGHIRKIYPAIGYAIAKDDLDDDGDSFDPITDATEHLRDRGL